MADLRALLAAATPGPWYVDGPEFGGLWVCCGSDAVSGPVHPGHPDQPYAVLAGMGAPDAALIVAAVNALPALLAVVDAAKAYAEIPIPEPLYRDVWDIQAVLRAALPEPVR